MNCWIILLLLCCCGKNNGMVSNNVGCGCDCHEHNHNSCIQPRVWEKDTCNVRREAEYDCNEAVSSREECGCMDNDRSRDKWMPYKEYNDNDRRDCNCK